MLNLIDTHVHFWDPAHLRYDWLAGSPSLNQVYRPDRLPAQGDGWRLERLVFVQADCAPEQGRAEVEWVSTLAADHPLISGIVAFAPLEHGERARDDVEWLARQPLVKGVRRLIQAEEPGFVVQPDFVQGVALLANHGLSFDLCLRNDQLPEAIELVRQCPAVSFVLDHIGNPDIEAGRRDPWRQDIAGLAALPNVVCKLSGVVTRANNQHWKPADLRPYIDHVLDVFGPERLMYGSDWPVVTLATTYGRWLELVLDVVSDLSTAERGSVLSTTAAAVYGLDR